MDTNPIRVLLVGDNYNEYIVTRNLLSKIGEESFDLAWVATYDAALDNMNRNQHDIYLINYRLGERNGIELLREAIANGCKAPIIILAEREDRKVDVEAMKAGAADYLVKVQIDAHRLERSIRYSINHASTLESLRESQRFLQSTLDALSAHIAILDGSGTIIAVNRAWCRFAEANHFGGAKWEAGMNYLDICESATGDFAEEAKTVAKGIREVIERQRDEFCLEYPCYSPTERRWFIVRVTRFSGDGPIRVVVVHENITERKLVEETLKENLAQLSKKNRYETVISTVTRSVHRSIDLHDVLENAVETMSKNIDGIDYVSIYLVEGEEAVMKAHRRYPPWFIKRVRRIPYPKGFTWKAIIEGKPLYCADVEQDTVIGLAGKALGTKSYVSIPIRHRDNVVGCININSLQKNAFDEEDLKLLRIVAQQIEGAFHNAQVAEALRQSEERYRTLFEQSPVGVYIFDKQLKITQCNERLAEILRSSYEKIIGLDMRKLKDQSFVPAMEKVLEGQSSYHEGFYEATTSQAKLWLSLSFSPLHDSDGNIIGGMGVVEDITARKQVEESLQESEMRFRAIFEGAAIGIALVDMEGRPVVSNPALQEMLGYSGEELRNMVFTEFTHPDDAMADWELFKELIEGKRDYYQMDKRYYSKDGRLVWGRLTVSLIRRAGGKANLAIGMVEDITARKLAEEALRNSEERYRVLYEENPSMYFTLDAEGTILSVNRFGAEQLGYTVEELAEQPIFTVFHPDDRKTVLERITGCLQNPGQIARWELRKVRKGKSIMWVKETARVVRDTEGNTIVLIACEDITECKRMEEALATEKERLAVTLHSIGDGVIATNTEGKIVLFNPAAETLTGWTQEEAVGRPLEEVFYIINEKTRERCKNPIEKVIKTGEIVGLAQHTALIARDGVERVVSASGAPVWNKDGNTIGGVLVFRDITKLKRAEEDLRESEKRYRALVENSYDLIYELDTKGQILYVNPNSRDVIGYESKELEGRSFFEFIHPDDLSAVRIEFGRAIVTFSAGQIIFRFMHKNGQWRWLECAGRLYQTATGETRGVIITRDITQRKQMEVEILKAQKLESIGILAGGIAHSFNTLLTAILGNISTTKGYTDMESVIYQRLSEAEETCLQAKNLAHQLLTFSKGDAPVKKVTSIGGLIRGLTSFILRGSNVTCEFLVEEDLIFTVEVDEKQISRVIHNLVVNAQEVMPEGGVIKVKAENVVIEKGKGIPLKEGSYVKITIEDQGIGIPEEHLPKIFDPYFTTKQGRLGLGLTIAYSIIKNHDGYIDVESRLGIGTKFSIYLPTTKKAISLEE